MDDITEAVYVKITKKKLSGGIETPDGVEPRRRVYSNHQNIQYFIIVTTLTASSLIQCLITATFHVRFQPSQGVEVGVERLTADSGVALNSYKVSVGDLNVAGEEDCVAVRRIVIIIPYNLHRVEVSSGINFGDD